MEAVAGIDVNDVVDVDVVGDPVVGTSEVVVDGSPVVGPRVMVNGDSVVVEVVVVVGGTRSSQMKSSLQKTVCRNPSWQSSSIPQGEPIGTLPHA